ncbi:MAG: hypothetical protein U0271_35295 [Polyangiaceae bacterium]
MGVVALVRWLHIITGSVALASFWVPIISKKGGQLHRRAGWVYSIAMWIASLAAWGVCAARLNDSDPSNDRSAIFLAFVGLLTANGAATGLRVLRRKSPARAQAGALDWALSVTLALSGVALALFGVRLGDAPLFLAFGLLGAVLGARQLVDWLRAPANRLTSVVAHMRNMLAACIGTVTAFLVVNAPRMGLAQAGLFVWLAPGVVGGVAIALWSRRMRGRAS